VLSVILLRRSCLGCCQILFVLSCNLCRIITISTASQSGVLPCQSYCLQLVDYYRHRSGRSLAMLVRGEGVCRFVLCISCAHKSISWYVSKLLLYVTTLQMMCPLTICIHSSYITHTILPDRFIIIKQTTQDHEDYSPPCHSRRLCQYCCLSFWPTRIPPR